MRTATLIIMISAAAFSADDPAGWDKARWGMTEPQLLRAFGPEAVRLDPALMVGRANVRLSVQPVDLANTRFRALLIPDGAGRLDSVLLGPVDHTAETESLFHSLEQLLVQKYGRPWTVREGGGNEIQWTVQTTVITLTLFHSPLTGETYVTVQYKRKTPSRL